MIDERRKSPLVHRAPLEAPNGGIQICERAFWGKLVLRVLPQGEWAGTLNLPLTASRSSEFEGAEVLWLGPDEWMFVTPPGNEGEMRARLLAVLEGEHHQLVDVSDYYTGILVSGGKAPECLMKLTPFDLHPRVFKNGDVAGSRFGHATAWIVNRSGNEPEFEIMVRWSMADYLWCLIAEAGREFGLPVQEPIGQVRGLRYKT